MKLYENVKHGGGSVILFPFQRTWECSLGCVIRTSSEYLYITCYWLFQKASCSKYMTKSIQLELILKGCFIQFLRFRLIDCSEKLVYF